MRRVDQFDVDIRIGALEALGNIAIGLHPARIPLVHDMNDGFCVGNTGAPQERRGGAECIA
ncbi:hypothetical protein D9M70_500550 [compost metagenome]